MILNCIGCIESYFYVGIFKYFFTKSSIFSCVG
jgi:hypothetical protein